jgi:hypothetical protein
MIVESMKRPTHPQRPTSLNVLFIGNSFTARNNLPALIAKLADAAGHHLDHRLISAGGASLRMHWNKGEATKAIESGNYDYVVLQEQSTLPIKNATRMHENVRLFDQIIRAAGAKTALYLTWARKHQPQSQEALTRAYLDIAKEIGATVIPAGVAWQQFMQKNSTPVLHDRDGSHPTLAGSYLAACVAFSALFNESAAKLRVEVKSLSDDEMKLIQSAAARTSNG